MTSRGCYDNRRTTGTELRRGLFLFEATFDVPVHGVVPGMPGAVLVRLVP